MRHGSVILVALLLFGLAGSAGARIGENQTQHSTRYGYPVGETNHVSLIVKGRVKKEYVHHAWSIKVTFFSDRAIRIEYCTPSGRRLADSDIQAIMKAENAGGPWHSDDYGSRTNVAGWRISTSYGRLTIEDSRTWGRMQTPSAKPPVPVF